jgi:hypothetical protein
MTLNEVRGFILETLKSILTFHTLGSGIRAKRGITLLPKSCLGLEDGLDVLHIAGVITFKSAVQVVKRCNMLVRSKRSSIRGRWGAVSSTQERCDLFVQEVILFYRCDL